ncbi:MAG: methionine--tRNA ligase [Clostridiales bacterium]|nr:methionine--tRNA ligase [Clostridiales bacterium]
MRKEYYITTPIYYPSNKLHIGNTYTTVAVDAMARYKKLRGYDVKFLTGMDEHGQKIENIAKETGISPKAYVDRIADDTRKLWEIMNADYDIFIRTTDDYHVKAVQKIFRTLYEKGDIYKSYYEGWYCTPDETFFTERQVTASADGGPPKCPDCGRPVEKIKEEAYFFKLSKYQDALIALIEGNPEFLMPQSRRNEMVNNFLKPGLEDLCVSRTSFKWGVPVDFDEGHVVYVWIDALSNYITALGYGSDNDADYRRYWPADLHVVGKEIVRFHTIIWPAILMALGEPLPKRVFGHGWLIVDGVKMSKSLGNVIDPKVLVARYGVDAIRYFLLREIVFGQDGNFTNEALIGRINSDLANDLGNLLSRTVGMIEKYFGARLPALQEPTAFDKEISDLAASTVDKVEECMDNMLFSDALAAIWTFVRRSNKYADETQPWVLVKQEGKRPQLANVLYTLAESLRITAVLISPFMPNTPGLIRRQLSITDDGLAAWETARRFGLLPREIEIEKGEIIFPRIDLKAELEKLRTVNTAEPEVSIEDFSKISMKVGKVVASEKVAGSDKLLKSQIKIGDEVRQVVSGIAQYYSPEEFVGKRVVVVTNLKPVKLRGVMSYGMILAAGGDEGELRLVTTDGHIAEGTVVR